MKTRPSTRSSPLVTLCRRRKVRFWGQNHLVTPRLVDKIFGDGLQVVLLSPLNTRPQHYLLRVDSRQSLDEDDWLDLLDEEIYPAIEGQFAPHIETWTASNGREHTRANPWPALNTDGGCAWNYMTTLNTSDRRTEAQLRQAIRRL